MELNGKSTKFLFYFSVFVAALAIQTLVLDYVAKVKRDNKVQGAVIYAKSIANAIQLTLDNNLEASQTLKYFYLQNGKDFLEHFDEVAEKIMWDNSCISSIYIAPNGVIEYAYPKPVNEETIGFEMFKDPAQGPRALLAQRTGKITVGGPHNLIEGGVGFIIRNPVFQDGDFIGFTIVVLDWDRYVREILSNVEYSSVSYKYAVWKDDYDETAVTDKDGYIFRNTPDSVSKKIDIEFVVPNDSWHLNVEPLDGWRVYREMLPSIIISIIISSFIVTLVIVLYLYWERTQIFMRKQAQTEAKTAFLNNMSHDIRTPMNAILGYTELMERRMDDKEAVSNYLFKMKKSGEYLLNIINNILEVSRIDSGKETIDEQFTDLYDEDCSVVPLLEVELNKKNITFNASMDIQHRYVLADMVKIKEINMNLISNAIKYTPEGGNITMRFVEIPCEKEGYATYINTITDTGIGMSKEFLTHVFDSFSRERNTTESKVVGSGLGMFIVKKLVDLMSGTITVESEPNKGTKFIVTLNHKILENPIEDKNSKKQMDFSAYEGKRILLAEDNDYNAEIAEEILEDSGLIVERAKDGLECIDMLNRSEEGYYSLILMDIQMPNMDGYTATIKIRNMNVKSKANIPIFAMTANAFMEDKKKAASIGMNGHISKPFKIEKLLEIIKNVL